MNALNLVQKQFREKSSNEYIDVCCHRYFPDNFLAGFDAFRDSPEYIEMKAALSLALRQWTMYVTDLNQKDLKDIDHTEAKWLKEALQILKATEQTEGK